VSWITFLAQNTPRPSRGVEGPSTRSGARRAKIHRAAPRSSARFPREHDRTTCALPASERAARTRRLAYQPGAFSGAAKWHDESNRRAVVSVAPPLSPDDGSRHRRAGGRSERAFYSSISPGEILGRIPSIHLPPRSLADLKIRRLTAVKSLILSHGGRPARLGMPTLAMTPRSPQRSRGPGFVVRSMHRFRFRRSPLPQPDRQDHDGQDCQELALPVLK